MQTAKWFSAIGFFLCAAVCAVPTHAQEGDLTSSAGVFIKPARAKTHVQPGGNSNAPHKWASHHGPSKTNTATPKTPTAESLNAKAGAGIDAKRYADAVEPLRQAVKLKPDFA